MQGLRGGRVPSSRKTGVDSRHKMNLWYTVKFRLTGALDWPILCVRMSRIFSTGAPEGTVSGTCRSSRRRGEAPRGKEWIRPYKLAQRMLDNAASMLISSARTVADAGCCAHRPIESTRKLNAALHQANVAARQYDEAERYLSEATAAFAGTLPELRSADAPELLEMVAERGEAVHRYLYVAVNEVLLGQKEIVQGVEAGELVPEDAQELADPRPRRRVIVIRHRPLFVRAFLAARQPRVSDRIAPLLQRRRRTRLPAEVRVPKRSLRGRAPPVSSTCSL
jgi:hypothetical protein